MASVEMCSKYIEGVCQERLIELQSQTDRIQEYLDAMRPIDHIHLFGKDLQNKYVKQKKLEDMIILCNMSDKIFITTEDLKLLEI